MDGTGLNLLVEELFNMKVLFVCSGNKKDIISPIVFNQGESIKKRGIDLDYYPIIGKGLRGYLNHIIPLRKKIKKGNYDIIHAHYTYHGIFVSFLTKKPIIVSIMGSFPSIDLMYYITRFFVKKVWKTTIVKSENTAKQLNLKDLKILPNGVDLEIFSNLEQSDVLTSELGLSNDSKHILFASDPSRPCKNYSLAQESVNLLADKKIKLIPVFERPQQEVVKYMSICNLLLLTSTSEGSPNVIKEALACNCPVVSVDVGDVKYVVGNTNGCFVVKSFNAEEIAKCIEKSLNTRQQCNGRERILKLGLDSKTIAKKLIEIYTTIL